MNDLSFQAALIFSGNLSFLNWLTILPSLAVFDDASLSRLFSPSRGSPRWHVRQMQLEQQRVGKLDPTWSKLLNMMKVGGGGGAGQMVWKKSVWE